MDNLQGEHYIKAVVGIGTPIGNIKDLAASFKEAQIAMEVGKVFDTEKQVISYDHLGIARLIYQLPTTLCDAFLKEVFKQDSIDSLDSETLFTIQRFFENNLNVSETSRGLFVHRNTLVYRLEKIKKLTGLDLRKFDDAIVFKVALMVKKYLSGQPGQILIPLLKHPGPKDRGVFLSVARGPGNKEKNPPFLSLEMPLPKFYKLITTAFFRRENHVCTKDAGAGES